MVGGIYVVLYVFGQPKIMIVYREYCQYFLREFKCLILLRGGLSWPEKVGQTNWENLVGRTLGINPQRIEVIPLDRTRFESRERFWFIGRSERIRGRSPEKATKDMVSNRCPRVISGVGEKANSLNKSNMFGISLVSEVIPKEQTGESEKNII